MNFAHCQYHRFPVWIREDYLLRPPDDLRPDVGVEKHVFLYPRFEHIPTGEWKEVSAYDLPAGRSQAVPIALANLLRRLKARCGPLELGRTFALFAAQNLAPRSGGMVISNLVSLPGFPYLAAA